MPSLARLAAPDDFARSRRVNFQLEKLLRAGLGRIGDLNREAIFARRLRRAFDDAAGLIQLHAVGQRAIAQRPCMRRFAAADRQRLRIGLAGEAVRQRVPIVEAQRRNDAKRSSRFALVPNPSLTSTVKR